MKSFEGGSIKKFTDITLATVPVFQRGGSIIPYKFRLRRSTKQMINDPFTLLIALNDIGHAVGELYLDDSISYGYRKNKEFLYREFEFINNRLNSR